MSINEHLMAGEEISATANNDDVTFYSTNRRIIRHKKGLFSEDVDSLPFSAITAVSFESDSAWGLCVVGVMVVIAGIYSGSKGIIERNVALITDLMGILLIVIGILSQSSRYQIKGMGMSDKDLERWRLTKTKNPDVKAFARMLEEKVMKEK